MAKLAQRAGGRYPTPKATGRQTMAERHLGFLPKHRAIARSLDLHEEGDAAYWDCVDRERSFRGGALYRYPAMMVPEIQGAVLDVLEEHADIRRVLDPFAGSGTVISEAMWRGLDVHAQDINPLSTLLCKVRAGPFYPDALAKKIQLTCRRIARDTARTIDVEFPYRTKWFKRAVSRDLCKIRAAIQSEDSSWARRFMWIALAQTVKNTCNSRPSTYKLHIRVPDESWKPAPIAEFTRITQSNLQAYRAYTKEMNESKLLERGRYLGNVSIAHGDTKKGIFGVSTRWKADLVVTSPPYGDNHTTVPYGQNSYLPLHWLDVKDIDGNIDWTLIDSPARLDSKSLGGSREGALDALEDLKTQSKVIKSYAELLRDKPRDAKVRFAAFFADLLPAVKATAARVKPGGFLVWTVGKRNLRGTTVPMDRILTELLKDSGFHRIWRKTRKIRQKRMAPRNSQSDTMTRESILVFGRKETT